MIEIALEKPLDNTIYICNINIYNGKKERTIKKTKNENKTKIM